MSSPTSRATVKTEIRLQKFSFQSILNSRHDSRAKANSQAFKNVVILLEWSDYRGFTWSNIGLAECGMGHKSTVFKLTKNWWSKKQVTKHVCIPTVEITLSSCYEMCVLSYCFNNAAMQSQIYNQNFGEMSLSVVFSLPGNYRNISFCLFVIFVIIV